MTESNTERPFIKRLLIANRGEIAVRVARACRELGISPVAVSSETDRAAYHVRECDASVELGPAPASESYLLADKVIRAALDTDCQAIHPGYGFLSQSADFAQAVADAGLIFVGPPPSAMRLMGNKTAARATMIDAGVPVVPGYQGTGDEDVEALTEAALKIGFPLLIKAAAGGGGKGMRIVRDKAEISAAVSSARREARKAFGDGRLFLERFVESARHIEVQVLADQHGVCVHLFERECSVQRRYQKIVEESPSPLLDHSLRQQICETAVAATKACGYTNAGTVEFLVSATDRSFFFLEMNTRLQVEHPVTELVTGIDLVAEQIRVAQNEPLRFAQADLAQRGHALECRIYAEDPAAGFVPSTGTVRLARFPQGPGIRVDAGVQSGDEVSVYYDPMIAKLIVWASTRDAALARMQRALDATAVLGITTNTDFLRAVLRHATFRDGEATTTWIETEFSDWDPGSQTAADNTSDDAALVALALQYALSKPDQGTSSATDRDGHSDQYSPWGRSDGFRLGEG